MNAAVAIEKLSKSFGTTRALDGLDLEVRVGEIHGLLGPNGAGKTTTLRVLLGLLRADSGVVRLLGGDPWRDVERLHRRLAYVPGEVTLWPNLTCGGRGMGRKSFFKPTAISARSWMANPTDASLRPWVIR